MTPQAEDRADEVVPPRTSRGPVVAFAGTCLLTLTALIGGVIAIAIFASQDISSSVGVSQTLTLIASLLSFIYLGLYLFAARRDGHHNTTGRPQQSIQAACFVILRIAVLIWIAAAAANLITTLAMPACIGSAALCKLEQANTGISWSASFAAFALMCVLERSSQPFHTPAALNIRPKIVCRISDFDDDILQRSVSFSNSVHSRRHSHAERHEMKKSEDSSRPHKIRRKSLAGSSSLNPVDPTLRLLPMVVSPSPDGNFESSWATDVHRALASSVSSVYSKASGEEDSSTNDTGEEDGSSNDTGLQTESRSNASQSAWTSTCSSSRKAGKATPTPSSSIGASSHRSPLSSVRTAENPEILIHHNLRHIPTPASPASWPPSTPRSQVSAYSYRPPNTPRSQVSAYSYRRPNTPRSQVSAYSYTPYLHHVHRRRPSKQHGKAKTHLRRISCERRAVMSRTGFFQVSRPSTPQSLVESAGGSPRKRKDILVPGAWVSYGELTDEHTRKIEVEIGRRAREIAAECETRDSTASEASSVLDPLETYSPITPPKETFDEAEMTETSIDPLSSGTAKQELEVTCQTSHKHQASEVFATCDPEIQMHSIARPTTIAISRAKTILIPSRSDSSLSEHSAAQSPSYSASPSTFSISQSPTTSPATIVTPPSSPRKDSTPPPSPSPLPSALRTKWPNRPSPTIPAAVLASPFPARASALPLPLTIRKVTSPALPADPRGAHPGPDERGLWHAPHSRRARGRNGEVQTPPDWPLPDPMRQFTPFVSLPREVESGRTVRTPVKSSTKSVKSRKSIKSPIQWRFLPPPERGDSAIILHTGFEGGEEKAVEVQGEVFEGLGLNFRQSRSVVQERSPRIASLRISEGFGWDD